ncbi:MAG: nuclear transport factor 2 family protein [Alphaproteobacteria bacterium]|nr:nuclear transport factor 2 family protein [Alphaproteobacteria bacterium]
MEDLVAALAMCVPITSGPIPSAVAVVDAFTEAYNEHDVAKLRELLTADAFIDGPFDEDATGAILVDRYEGGLFKQLPDVRLRVQQRLATSDFVAQIEEWSFDGKVQGTGLSTYRVDSGCIVSMSYSQ